jgi:UPF0716 protein FxsA
MRFFWIVFVFLPIAEIWVFIKVGQRIGAAATIGLVLLSSIIGLLLLRRQGYAAVVNIRRKLDSGQLPATEMMEGIFLSLAGVLLLLPGFITDGLGFLCLVRGFRRWILARVFARLSKNPDRKPSANPAQNTGTVIDGSFTREE